MEINKDKAMKIYADALTHKDDVATIKNLSPSQRRALKKIINKVVEARNSNGAIHTFEVRISSEKLQNLEARLQEAPKGESKELSFFLMRFFRGVGNALHLRTSSQSIIDKLNNASVTAKVDSKKFMEKINTIISKGPGPNNHRISEFIRSLTPYSKEEKSFIIANICQNKNFNSEDLIKIHSLMSREIKDLFEQHIHLSFPPRPPAVYETPAQLIQRAESFSFPEVPSHVPPSTLKDDLLDNISDNMQGIIDMFTLPAHRRYYAESDINAFVSALGSNINELKNFNKDEKIKIVQNMIFDVGHNIDNAFRKLKEEIGKEENLDQKEFYPQLERAEKHVTNVMVKQLENIIHNIGIDLSDKSIPQEKATTSFEKYFPSFYK